MTRLHTGMLAVLGAAASALAQAPVTKVLDCTNAGCHAKQLDHQFLHGPTAVHACDSCHEYVDPAKHSFQLKRQGRDLCTFCHIDKTGTEGPVVHAPVAKGDCLACHDPHGGASAPLLKKDPMPVLCADCHKDVLNGSHIHGPAATDCTACHKAHTSDHKKLLILEGKDLCIHCHEDVGKTVLAAAHQHKPATDDCLQCHSPHASNNEAVLKAPPAELCTSCHADVAKAAANASHPHGAVTDGRACLNCHAPHGSEHAKLMSKDTVSTCLVCHAKPIKVDDHRTVPAVAEMANPKLHKHGPIETGDCAGCHGVHGGPHDHLLQRNLAGEFYNPFSEGAYSLCFKCHDKKLVLSPTTEGDTKFRDGERNLHYLHVNKTTQGRSCRACHATHASRFEQQIADSVTFGQWKLPINYQPTETGGSCAPGCHKPQKYDRGATTMPALDGTGPAAAK